MTYYSVLWFMAPSNPLRHEYVIGFAIGFWCGLPAWIGLPILIIHGRKTLDHWVQLALSLPLVALVLITVVLGFLGAL